MGRKKKTKTRSFIKSSFLPGFCVVCFDLCLRAPRVQEIGICMREKARVTEKNKRLRLLRSLRSTRLARGVANVWTTILTKNNKKCFKLMKLFKIKFHFNNNSVVQYYSEKLLKLLSNFPQRLARSTTQIGHQNKLNSLTFTPPPDLYRAPTFPS